MNLWMLNYIYEQGLTKEQFFRLAHIWRFDKDYDAWQDAATFRIHGIVPQFVREYVAHIQENPK